MSPDQKFHPQFDDPEAEIIISSKEGTLFRVHSAILKSASDLLRLFLSRPSIAAATEASTHFESFAPAKHLPSALSAGGWRERQKAREAAAAADKGGGWGDSRPKRSEPATSFMEDAAPRNEGKLDDTSADVITVPFFDKPLERVLLIISAKPIPPWQSFAELEAAMEVMDYLDTPGPISYIRYWCLTPVFLSEPIRLYGLGARYGWEDVMQHASKLTPIPQSVPNPAFS
ncbi:hypothetical protein NP233_g4358 [Leucocoprinus birnbaumii]|uniref:BTB domain-containing protein n=1 Tax=Leucocoprinus birnbaumii TaxID=56174 RepID=A0AAD5YRX8_9AGAR|nr:hypothetical protein NP233_g4358 [Leucocoprinus birnbaumii]